jgi:type 1 glutamine amidotransferase
MTNKILLFPLLMLLTGISTAQEKNKKADTKNFRIVVLFENGGHHLEFTDAAQPWLNKLAEEEHFRIDYITRTDTIDEAFLKDCRLFLQLDYVPYGWTEKAQHAFIKYIEKGRGGWIGLHHAGLLGDFDGYSMWSWFCHFMGDIKFRDYIPTFAGAEVDIEDSAHPVVRGLPKRFLIEKEEWYTWEGNPRDRMHVIASVNESTYIPDSPKKMGDHPVIWSNPGLPGRNIYIFMGHSPELFKNSIYTALLRNAILWACGKG